MFDEKWGRCGRDDVLADFERFQEFLRKLNVKQVDGIYCRANVCSIGAEKEVLLFIKRAEKDK